MFGTGNDLLDRHEALRALPLSPSRAMKAGDATVHGSLMVHGASANRTDFPRWARTSIYFDDACRARVRFTDPQLEGNIPPPGQPFDHPAYPLVF